jgi:hypothetical protein
MLVLPETSYIAFMTHSAGTRSGYGIGGRSGPTR